MKVRLLNEGRASGGEYAADLEVGGAIVGRVERGLNQGGRRANQYVARINRVTVAEASRLNELLAEIRANPEEVLALVADLAADQAAGEASWKVLP